MIASAEDGESTESSKSLLHRVQHIDPLSYIYIYCTYTPTVVHNKRQFSQHFTGIWKGVHRGVLHTDSLVLPRRKPPTGSQKQQTTAAIAQAILRYAGPFVRLCCSGCSCPSLSSVHIVHQSSALTLGLNSYRRVSKPPKLKHPRSKSFWITPPTMQRPQQDLRLSPWTLAQSHPNAPAASNGLKSYKTGCTMLSWLSWSPKLAVAESLWLRGWPRETQVFAVLSYPAVATTELK